jgi:predicted nuclease of predicted toxin-antitoxin system
MRFLADESCDFAVVCALRGEGNDVMTVAESALGIEDDEVIALAVREGRIVLTEDKDFGGLVYAHLLRLAARPS